MSGQAEDFLRRKTQRGPTDPRLSDLPSGPGDPRWKDRIPPGEPELFVASIDAPEKVMRVVDGGYREAEPETHFVGTARRVVLAYGPKPGSFMISVERPQSDSILVTVRVTRAAVQQMYPVLEALGAIKNLTGASFAAFSHRQETAPRAAGRGTALEGEHEPAAGPADVADEGDSPEGG